MFRHIGNAANFLCIWRASLTREKGKTLKDSFISREGYQDVLLSCHNIFLFMKVSCDYALVHPVCFSTLGTDACEEYFSSNGSFIVNKHKYSITDMYTNLSHMNGLQEIFSDSGGPENPRKHRKGEEIWFNGSQNGHIEAKANLQDFPDDETIVKCWDAGLKEAQDHLKSLGLKSRNLCAAGKVNDWFHCPQTALTTNDKSLNLRRKYTNELIFVNQRTVLSSCK